MVHMYVYFCVSVCSVPIYVFLSVCVCGLFSFVCVLCARVLPVWRVEWTRASKLSCFNARRCACRPIFACKVARDPLKHRERRAPHPISVRRAMEQNTSPPRARPDAPWLERTPREQCDVPWPYRLAAPVAAVVGPGSSVVATRPANGECGLPEVRDLRIYDC